jgi:pullulanase
MISTVFWYNRYVKNIKEEFMFKKLIIGSFLLLFSIVFISCNGEGNDTTVATTEEPTQAPTTVDPNAGSLVVHYFRFDEDYDPWSLWIWPSEPESLEGVQYFFDGQDDYGMVAEIPLVGDLAGATQTGIIVRTADWGKDVATDRFVDLTNPDEEGDIHIYLVQNTEEIYYDIDDVDLGDRINFVQFTDDRTIEFTATTSVEETQITLYKNDVELTISSYVGAGNDGVITIGEDVDLTNRYHLEIDFDAENSDRSMVRFDGFYDSQAFNQAFYYDGDLGAIYEPNQTTFRLWAPISESVSVNLYTKGHTASQEDYLGVAGVDNPYDTIAMTSIGQGVFEVVVDGDLDGVYYTYTIVNDGVTHEVVDPYAYSAGINGKRGMVIDFSNTNPNGWSYGDRPDTMTNYTDAIVYEIHVRDLTSHESWNGTEAYRGKFLGLTERGTTYQGVTTGLDHIIDLGVTHVQFVPIFDHGIINETRLNDESYYGIHDGIFNWGYMPENFNVIEGSYSTDPYNGHTRGEELKTMIQTFHDNDIRVIMDVVYNHTGKSADSNFDLILPGYYFRMNEDGTFSNGSGTGNETASERAMMRKYIVDSLLFWTEEYNIDGYRFDLMALHDVDTMNQVKAALHAIDPTIIIYGEPWTGGDTPLPFDERAWVHTIDEIEGVGIFNDKTRDGIKGSVFQEEGTGFVQGNLSKDNDLIYGILGGMSSGANPTQTVNYVTAHDNNTLYDKLRLSTTDLTMNQLTMMQRQSNAIVLTSQGIAFLHGGVEIMRTKPCVEGGNTCDSENRFDHNSYRSPDETNQYDWQWKVDHIETFNYYKNLIELRKAKDVFRLSTRTEIDNQVSVLDDGMGAFIAYLLTDANDYWKTTYVIHNGGSDSRTYTLQAGTTWNLVMKTSDAGTFNDQESFMETIETFNGGQTITLAANETYILYSTDLID